MLVEELRPQTHWEKDVGTIDRLWVMQSKACANTATRIKTNSGGIAQALSLINVQVKSPSQERTVDSLDKRAESKHRETDMLHGLHCVSPKAALARLHDSEVLTKGPRDEPGIQ